MDTTPFIVTGFCLIDGWLKGRSLRQRGPAPVLCDSEVLTMEIVGEFLGIDTDSGLYGYFCRHFSAWFPALPQVHRTPFVRQAANLWAVKQQLWRALIGQIVHAPLVSVTDSLPIPVCRFARAYRCRILAGETAFGKDQGARQTFVGLRAHVRLSRPGLITDFRRMPANLQDLEVAEELFTEVQGWVLGDRTYWSPALQEQGRRQGLTWVTPFKSAQREKKPWPKWLSHKRYWVDTVFSQLTERFHVKKVWARDAWHFLSRWLREILSHTLAVFLGQQLDLPPLHFAELLTD